MTTINTKFGLGTTAEGFRVVLHVRYGPDDMGNAERNPTPVSAQTHEPIPYPHTLSITGEVCDLSKRRSSPDFVVGAGQCIDDARAVTKPCGTLTLDDVQRLADIWQRWHLNAMRAGCDHIDTSIVPDDLPSYVSYDDRKAGRQDRQGWMLDNLVCPVSGYRYGSAWLAEPVPEEVIADLASIIDKATTKEVK